MIQSETLDLLEWPRLCQQWATFAATKLGALAARHGRIPEHQSESERLLAQTREAYQLEEKAPLNFRGVQDMGDALERAKRQGILSGEELLEIATTLAGARQLRRTIDAQEEKDFPVLQSLVAQLRTYPELEKEIHHCIDDRGKVTDRANPKLAGIRKNLKNNHDQLHAKLQRIMQRHGGALQETLITQRAGRFVVPVKAPQKDAIPGIVHDVSTSGATLYIEPQSVVEFGNRLRQLERQETREEELVRQQLSGQVAEVSEDLEQLMAIITTLDLATARARYSLWLEANPPRFSTAEERTVLRQLRHPILVWQQRHEEGATVVPIDITMRPDIRVVAITGPNTGGKTVTLKTLGLAALMAKVGLFVPAREPVELPWFDLILADIGDEQSIEQSLSTFSGHIRRIGRILEAIGAEGDANNPESVGDAHPATTAPTQADASGNNALVLLDEVGAGTDPTEGSALAIALLQHLADHTRLAVATTHFGELKALKYQDERFENASVEFDDVSLSPTYRLLWGIPGRSNALTIARRLGLNSDVIDTAQTYVGVSKQEDVNQVIAGLEAQRKRQEDQAEQAACIVAQAEALKADIERKSSAIKEWERHQKLEQEKAIQAAVAQAKTEIATVIRQLQKGKPTAQAAQKATELVESIAQQQSVPKGDHPAKKVITDYKPKLGEKVRLIGLGGQTAEVVEAPDADGKVIVRFGLMKTVVELSDIESLTGQKAAVSKPAVEKVAEKKRTTTAKVAKKEPAAPAVRTSRNTIDLRGMRVAEAEADLENFIAKSTGPIWIIHGHGTGKLKRGVREFLKRHPQVRSFEHAEQADGGTGVTVAQV
ncbi:2 family protein [Leptolyngbya sp. Heron Island J]|uniref:endonuclease MutS2 n=1 Tax=Leptolyngbya sp. Heron Island J TaxID=1385935 RepID=UPI0003B949E1|nr:endonuclease MutS2 [Leptolyngbya sp. Heron Island J]ESA32355.1 2 family protein [Leptolyngbya sp. Heron Island J]